MLRGGMMMLLLLLLALVRKYREDKDGREGDGLENDKTKVPVLCGGGKGEDWCQPQCVFHPSVHGGLAWRESVPLPLRGCISFGAISTSSLCVFVLASSPSYKPFFHHPTHTWFATPT